MYGRHKEKERLLQEMKCLDGQGSYVVSHSLYRAKGTTIAEVRVYYPKKRWAACSKG